MYYKLVDGKTVPVGDIMTWGTWWETTDRRVGLDKIGDSEISTVFLGFDHRFSGDGAPILFETLVFGGKLADEMERYCTLEQAQEGHKSMVQRVKEAQVTE